MVGIECGFSGARFHEASGLLKYRLGKSNIVLLESHFSGEVKNDTPIACVAHVSKNCRNPASGILLAELFLTVPDVMRNLKCNFPVGNVIGQHIANYPFVEMEKFSSGSAYNRDFLKFIIVLFWQENIFSEGVAGFNSLIAELGSEFIHCGFCDSPLVRIRIEKIAII